MTVRPAALRPLISSRRPERELLVARNAISDEDIEAALQGKSEV
jgi:hypothetical protein